MSKSEDAVAQFADTAGLSEQQVNQQSELEAIRKLLFASERTRLDEGLQRLEQLETKLSDPKIRARDASEILVPAVRLRLSADEDLGDALKPVVVSQFHETAREDPDVMAEALFPILGPAMRKMITAMLTPDKNAKRRRHKLEQLFLIEKETGLPVCHVSSENTSTQDADMVSGMLNAIQSFVHEAFSADEFDGLNTMQVGELSVWIEWGPSAVLAAVIRGAAPQNLRNALQIKLEEIHQDYSDEFTDYSGDTTPFEPLRPDLHRFLDSHDGSLKNKVRNLPSRIKKILTALSLALLLLIIWTVYGAYDTKRWNHYVAQVQQLPGIVVTDSKRSFREYHLSGLRDPLAQPLNAALEASGIEEKYVTYHFKNYQALHPDFTLRRLIKLLDPPPGIILTFEASTLYIRGNVGLENREWLEQAKKMAPVVTGVDRVYLAD